MENTENHGNNTYPTNTNPPMAVPQQPASAPHPPQQPPVSYFDGKTIQLIGWRLLGALLTGVTLGIGAPWAQCMIYRWRISHTVVNGRRLKFTGTGLQLLGRYLLWGLLTLITFGIYAIFLPVRVAKWESEHTCFDDQVAPPQTKSGNNNLPLILGIAAAVLVFVVLVGVIIGAMLQYNTPSQGVIPNTSETTSATSDTATVETYHFTVPQSTVPENRYYVHAYGGLNIRSGPGTEYEVLGRLENGQPVEVLDWAGTWAHIKDSVEGWCSSEYLKKEPLSGMPDVSTAGKIDPAEYIKGQTPASTALVGQWLHAVQCEPGYEQQDAYLRRTGVLTLFADGTFDHVCYTSAHSRAGYWYSPGSITSGDDCPRWKGTYSYNGQTLTLKYMLSAYWDYDYTNGPVLVDSGWFEISHTVSFQVTMEPEVQGFRIDAPANLPCYSGLLPDAGTMHTLYYLGDVYAETSYTRYDKLNSVFAGGNSSYIPSSGQIDPSILGSWTVASSGTAPDGTHKFFLGGSWTFNEDGTFTHSDIECQWEYHPNGTLNDQSIIGTGSLRGKGYYSFDGHTLTLTYTHRETEPNDPYWQLSQPEVRVLPAYMQNGALVLDWGNYQRALHRGTLDEIAARLFPG